MVSIQFTLSRISFILLSVLHHHHHHAEEDAEEEAVDMLPQLQSPLLQLHLTLLQPTEDQSEEDLTLSEENKWLLDVSFWTVSVNFENWYEINLLNIPNSSYVFFEDYKNSVEVEHLRKLRVPNRKKL